MKKLFLPFLCISVVFFSCKKNNTDTAVPGITFPKVKTYTIGGDNVTYTYDAQGRILTRVNTASNWKYEYSYTANTATENYFVGTTLSTAKVYDLNADGLVTKETYTLPAASVPYKTVYTYNANKQVATLVKSNSINTNTTTEINFYTGTTLDSSQTTFSYNNDLYRFWYTYYTDKTTSITNKNQGYLFWAETAAMPLKKQTSIFRTNGFFNTQVDDYTYTFDAENRITKRTITTAGGGGTSVNDITYY
jgi:YD repeat-containing protein